MNRLTTLDAGFLKAEDADPRVSLAIGGLAVIEGPAPDQSALMSQFAERIRACPRFGQRLRLWPFDLGAPQWVDDPSFDIGRHVRRVALPQPGDDPELFRVVADLMARRLDRDRPLWEIWVIEGLSDGRWAMLTKIHHCMADGIAATHMLAGLCDDGVGDTFARHVRAAKEAKRPAVEVNPLAILGGLWSMSASVTAGVARAAQGAAEIALGLLRPAPSTLNGPISDLRRYSGARVSLADVEQVCRAFDVTINDVALAAITESYRNLLVRRGERLQPGSLRTLVPVSMRSTDAFDKTDNRVSVMLPQLPIDEENPVRRLRAVHARLDRTKAGGQRQAGNAFVSMANHVPFAFTAWALGLLTRLPQRGVVTVATNVPGPRRRLRVMGKKVLGVFPVPPIAMQLRTGVAMLSYADDLFIGILADYDGVADVDELARGIEAAVARLVAISKRRKAHYARGPLSLVV
ncbi:diacylglycerol O-acyltransferase [Mycobacterium florentinum]|uniref:Diacylglycerol O-acyltransferase n=1 Tax=Mycobacterium florentinum TaxID=292462 RepID=A0A1X1TTL0_MYCFL|nr:wax ester/triacylglycerol synthase family O-acyltransferase [Mycobacterium florentinum]MCV7408314.1 wax ester/triacylglycerol synthase family O-acyltransferase [Mycobacterium florentinum]ORV47883.1 diacylglycerol O-acyltransferase [Mycobacterium florentinum]BBX78192.1 putative diacyglycerol O-acyltransferase tgs1 [Mycobacterium florentinum]